MVFAFITKFLYSELSYKSAGVLEAASSASPAYTEVNKPIGVIEAFLLTLKSLNEAALLKVRTTDQTTGVIVFIACLFIYFALVIFIYDSDALGIKGAKKLRKPKLI